jgi:hypothetical protein
MVNWEVLYHIIISRITIVHTLFFRTRKIFRNGMLGYDMNNIENPMILLATKMGHCLMQPVTRESGEGRLERRPMQITLMLATSFIYFFFLNSYVVN